MSLPYPTVPPAPTIATAMVNVIPSASLSPLGAIGAIFISVALVAAAAWAFRCVSRIAWKHIEEKPRSFWYETGVWLGVLAVLALMTFAFYIPIIIVGLYEIWTQVLTEKDNR